MSVDLAELMNQMLATACPSRVIDEVDEVKEFYIETHCVGFWVTARHLGNLKYEVQSYYTVSA